MFTKVMFEIDRSAHESMRRGEVRHLVYERVVQLNSEVQRLAWRSELSTFRKNKILNRNMLLVQWSESDHEKICEAFRDASRIECFLTIIRGQLCYIVKLFRRRRRRPMAAIEFTIGSRKAEVRVGGYDYEL